jgi:hypothetical protein
MPGETERSEWLARALLRRWYHYAMWDTQPMPPFERAAPPDARGSTALRAALLGCVRAAKSGLALREPSETWEPLCMVDALAATEAFRNTSSEAAVDLRRLLEVFMPVTILYPSPRRASYAELTWWQDEARPDGFIKGLVWVSNRPVEGESGAIEVLGETFFMPPASRGAEGRLRSNWVRAARLDLPQLDEAGGPFWKLGQSESWRLQVMSGAERLVLAGLIGANAETCAVLAPLRSFPRVGFVCETARRLGRTIACVPWEAIPADLADELQRARRRGLQDAEEA